MAMLNNCIADIFRIGPANRRAVDRRRRVLRAVLERKAFKLSCAGKNLFGYFGFETMDHDYLIMGCAPAGITAATIAPGSRLAHWFRSGNLRSTPVLKLKSAAASKSGI